MATIEIVNASQETPEAPVKIQVSSGNIYYQGPKGDTPVKGVDYFTPADIAEVLAQVPEVDLTPYATKTEVAAVATNAATNYATKTELTTAIQNAVSGVIKRQVVQTLPISDIDNNTIYMVPKDGEPGDVYYEYLYVNNAWEYLGSTEVDLTDYATINYVDQRIASPKTKYTIVSHTAYAGSDTQVFDEFPQALKDILWAWASNLSSYQWEISADFASYSQGAEQFEVYLDRGLGAIDKIDHIIAQTRSNTKYIFLCQRGITSLGYDSYERNQVNYGLKTLLQLTMPNNNASWAAQGMSGTYYYVLTGISAKDVITTSRQQIGGVYYNTVDAIIRRKQNQLTAGTGITIANDVISAVASAPEPLTSSEVQTIWSTATVVATE